MGMPQVRRSLAGGSAARLYVRREARPGGSRWMVRAGPLSRLWGVDAVHQTWRDAAAWPGEAGARGGSRCEACQREVYGMTRWFLIGLLLTMVGCSPEWIDCKSGRS